MKRSTSRFMTLSLSLPDRVMGFILCHVHWAVSEASACDIFVGTVTAPTIHIQHIFRLIFINTYVHFFGKMHGAYIHSYIHTCIHSYMHTYIHAYVQLQMNKHSNNKNSLLKRQNLKLTIWIENGKLIGLLFLNLKVTSELCFRDLFIKFKIRII